MINEFAKEYLHDELRWIRETMLRKLDGLSEYDVRRPLTVTGTNLLGLVKHLSTTEAWYLGEVFGRPFDGPVPRWDDDTQDGTDMWATEDETRAEIVDRYRRTWAHSDATIGALAIGAPGHVPWWPRPDVKLFNVMVHVLTETSRHAGHADILREQLDGRIGETAGDSNPEGRDAAFWESRRADIERAARAAARLPQRVGESRHALAGRLSTGPARCTLRQGVAPERFEGKRHLGYRQGVLGHPGLREELAGESHVRATPQ